MAGSWESSKGKSSSWVLEITNHRPQRILQKVRHREPGEHWVPGSGRHCLSWNSLSIRKDCIFSKCSLKNTFYQESRMNCPLLAASPHQKTFADKWCWEPWNLKAGFTHEDPFLGYSTVQDHVVDGVGRKGIHKVLDTFLSLAHCSDHCISFLLQQQQRYCHQVAPNHRNVLFHSSWRLGVWGPAESRAGLHWNPELPGVFPASEGLLATSDTFWLASVCIIQGPPSPSLDNLQCLCLFTRSKS